ncbi:MAG: hypothetical protein AAFY26_10825 [Cyanobacteria bacterium J06638_22]
MSFSSQVWQLASWLEEATTRPDMRLWVRQLRRYTQPGWLLSAAVFLTLLATNGRFMLVSGAGLGAATLCLRAAKSRKTRRVWRGVRRRIRRPTTVAIAAGTLTTVNAYAILRLTEPFGDSGLAAGLAIEGLLVLAVLLGLSSETGDRRHGQWEEGDRPKSRTQSKRYRKIPMRSLDSLLEQLAHPTPLKRLLAIRHLTDWIADHPQQLNAHAQITDCFRVMLREETDPTLRQALISQVDRLDRSPRLGKGTPPVAIPLQQRRMDTMPVVSDVSLSNLQAELLREPEAR